MPRDPKDISTSAPAKTQRRIGELGDQEDAIRLRVGTGPAGAEGPKGEKGEKGETGATGEKGAEGRAADLHYTWLTNTEATNPGAGKIKRNVGSTALYISETDKDANAIAAVLATWDDSTTTTARGLVTIRQVGSPGRFIVFQITAALTDNGEWDTFTVTKVSEGSAPENEKEVTVEFSRTGDKGAQGEKGEKGEKGETGATGESGKEGPAGAASMNGYKEPCRAATTANITISTALNPGDTLDGVVLAENDRVLVKNQTTKKENGIWIVKAVPVRSTDADAAGELRGGTTVYVEEGTPQNADRHFAIKTNGSITPGTTEHEWAALTPKVAEGTKAVTIVKGGFEGKGEVSHGLGLTPRVRLSVEQVGELGSSIVGVRITNRSSTVIQFAVNTSTAALLEINPVVHWEAAID